MLKLKMVQVRQQAQTREATILDKCLAFVDPGKNVGLAAVEMLQRELDARVSGFVGRHTQTIGKLIEGRIARHALGDAPCAAAAEHDDGTAKTHHPAKGTAQICAQCVEVGGRRAPGHGGYDYAGFMRALETAGYDRRISAECSWEDLQTEAPGALAYMREAWEKR